MNAEHMHFCAGPDWQKMVVERILPLALEGVDLGDEVLEIGPGPGFTTDVLMTRAARLTAVEIDDGLAGDLARRLAGSNVEVVKGDATALDQPDSHFTGAASFNMLHHVPTEAEQDRIFAELARVLQTGATLVAADGVYNEATLEFHRDDTYNPIEAMDLAPRLSNAGFIDIEVREYELGWVCTAHAV